MGDDRGDLGDTGYTPSQVFGVGRQERGGAEQVGDAILGHDQVGRGIVQVSGHLSVDAGQESVEEQDECDSQAHAPDAESQPNLLLK